MKKARLSTNKQLIVSQSIVVIQLSGYICGESGLSGTRRTNVGQPLSVTSAVNTGCWLRDPYLTRRRRSLHLRDCYDARESSEAYATPRALLISSIRFSQSQRHCFVFAPESLSKQWQSVAETKVEASIQTSLQPQDKGDDVVVVSKRTSYHILGETTAQSIGFMGTV